MTITSHGSNTDNINLKQWVAKLLHTINTWIERNPVTSGELASIPAGTIVYPSADDTVSAAVLDIMNDTASHWVGVTQKGIPVGGRGVIKTAGYTRVMFKDGETMVNGALAYVSDEAGKATMVAGGPRIGIVANASEYSPTNPFAFVYLRSGCILSFIE